MSDHHEGPPSREPRGDVEPTQPLSRPPVGPGGAAWLPPAHLPPPGWGPQTRPMPAAPRRAQPAGWVWPVVVGLALVVGLLGGVGGAMLVGDVPDAPGIVDDGLEGVDTRERAPLTAGNRSVVAVADQLLPSTVQIRAELDGQAGGATGSGFVLDRQGHVITNNHVVQEADEGDGPIQLVDQDGNTFDAEVVGRSPVYDLAVLYSRSARRLPPASLGSSRRLAVGEAVVAFGSPLGLSSTVTSGIVSALNRPVTTGDSNNDTSYINAVQTDAAINPGNSGGPLVDLQGQVVGVNSAIATTGGGLGGRSGNIGVGFAIPIEQVRVTADQILRTGEARYPVIGAQVQTGGPSEVQGARIDEVMADTPAEQSGLEVGDVITEVNGLRVTDGIALIVAIRSYQPGETIEFTLTRDGEEQTVEVRLGAETG
ncbi:S1C family serine protease [Nocardioides sp. GXQ0305]|uniref:S1C family serine protease n=1 Tax=Nocardioides sp. GXQ0305 TaxID=3423912 RepID=UPI003D7CC94F